jgi:hypothetical protein
MRLRARSWLVALGSAAALALGVTAGVALAHVARPAAPSPIQRAATKTLKTAGERVSFTLVIGTGTGGLGATAISLTGKGVVDNQPGSAQLKVHLGAFAPVLSALVGTAVPEQVDVVISGGVIYARIPSLARKQFGSGKDWLLVDPATLPKSSTGGLDLSLLKSLNLQQALLALTAGGAAKKIGSQRIGGATTTHYSTTVDAARLALAFPKSERAQVLALLKQLGVKTVPAEVYVGPSGYLRRVVATLPKVKLQTGAPPASLKLSLDLTGYGLKVSVAPPPTAQTGDAGSLVAKILAGLTGSGG